MKAGRPRIPLSLMASSSGLNEEAQLLSVSIQDAQSSAMCARKCLVPLFRASTVLIYGRICSGDRCDCIVRLRYDTKFLVLCSPVLIDYKPCRWTVRYAWVADRRAIC